MYEFLQKKIFRILTVLFLSFIILCTYAQNRSSYNELIVRDVRLLELMFNNYILPAIPQIPETSSIFTPVDSTTTTFQSSNTIFSLITYRVLIQPHQLLFEGKTKGTSDTLTYIVLETAGSTYRLFGFAVTDIRYFAHKHGGTALNDLAKALLDTKILKSSRVLKSVAHGKEGFLAVSMNKPCEILRAVYGDKNPKACRTIVLPVDPSIPFSI